MATLKAPLGPDRSVYLLGPSYLCLLKLGGISCLRSFTTSVAFLGSNPRTGTLPLFFIASHSFLLSSFPRTAALAAAAAGSNRAWYRAENYPLLSFGSVRDFFFSSPVDVQLASAGRPNNSPPDGWATRAIRAPLCSAHLFQDVNCNYGTHPNCYKNHPLASSTLGAGFGTDSGDGVSSSSPQRPHCERSSEVGSSCTESEYPQSNACTLTFLDSPS